jgi:outer membrane protein TolC
MAGLGNFGSHEGGAVLRRRSWIVGLLCAVGCSRSHYRLAADRETYPIIGERVVKPEYAIGRTNIVPPPDSRLADPTNPDAPPKPPDDPAAAIFMANPGGMKGYRGWEKDGVAPSIESAGWEAALGLDETGTLKLDGDRATEIALANSRQFQTQLENVYIQALALTLNRFEFDLQFFLRRNTSFQHIGTSSLPGESNTFLNATNFGYSKNLAAGGQLLADFANSFVWEFTGRTRSASSSLGATLVQPLLRGFGRNVRLESLTQAERDTLYAVRDYARFRKQFWASINVDGGGYLQLLRQVQGVRNARANLRSQEENYALYQKLFQGGRTQVANVDQVYQALLSARRDLISSEIELQNSLDRYKIQLGLPPRLKIELDDSPLNRFVLVDPSVDKLREELDQFERARKAELDAAPSIESLKDSLAALAGLASRTERIVAGTESALASWEADLARPALSEDPEQTARAKEAYGQQKGRPGELRAQLKAITAEIERQRGSLTEANREAAWRAVVAATRDLAAVADAAISVESQARIYTLRLPDQPETEEALLPFALENRLDLQNAQGQVTDAWRRVSVAANALKSDVTVRLDGQLVTPPGGTNPFAFGAAGSRIAAALQVDGPLNRQAERNQYRLSLINYQRSRRDYMQLSDSIELDVRTGLRELRRQRINFEIARQQLLVAVRQLAIERRLLTAPVQDRRGDDGAATLRILNAQQSLLVARNGLADSFFNYEQQRIRLLINSEKLLLDERGVPTDDYRAASAGPAPPGEP